MPDTKDGRERKGLDKEAQLERRLNEREIRALDREDDEPERFDGADGVDGELLVDPTERDD